MTAEQLLREDRKSFKEDVKHLQSFRRFLNLFACIQLVGVIVITIFAAKHSVFDAAIFFFCWLYIVLSIHKKHKKQAEESMSTTLTCLRDNEQEIAEAIESHKRYEESMLQDSSNIIYVRR